MHRFAVLGLVGLSVVTTGLAWAQRANGPRRPLPVFASTPVTQDRPAKARWVGFGGVTPASITFTSSNPSGSVAGAATASIQLDAISGGFTVYAKAVAANFTGCNAPPAGSITVACSAASGVTCAAPAPLASTGKGTIVATGSGLQFPAKFTVTYTFQDDWSYQVGTGCSLNVQYTAAEPN